MNIIYKYFLLFFIYSILGWIVESIYSSILEKKLVDRGFLIGPYCPIYGTGAIIGILYLTQYKSNPLTVFILGIVISCIIEYVTSYLMEKLFKARWWDYSNYKYNLNGRICGRNALLFGICSLLIIFITEPPIELIVSRLNNHNLQLISIVSFIIFLTDIIISYNIINKLKTNLNNMEIKKDSTYEIKALVIEALNVNINGKIKKNKLQKRLIQAFPTLDINKYLKKRNERIENIKRLFK